MINILQTILHGEIPLTREMGIKVEKYSGLSLTLSAPLDKNVNHKNTAFGGSLYSVSVLSGWSLIYLAMRERNLAGHIVIQESHTRFFKPVAAELVATCSFDSHQQLDKFISMFQRKGLARINLEARIASGAGDGVLFNGRYVVHQ